MDHVFYIGLLGCDGYLRILKCGLRAGDKAPMAYIELVDRSAQADAAEVPAEAAAE